MAEYIEREAACALMPDDYYGWRDKQLLKSVPAADVVPVRHGRWNVSRTDYGWNGAQYPTHCKCSLCGREIPYQDQDRYCPNCGAIMDKEKE